MHNTITIDPLQSFLIAIIVLFVGNFLKKRVAFLDKYNIPEPIIGGLIAAILITVPHLRGIAIEFSLPLKDTFMMLFFSTVGLTASYKQLAKGGFKVFLFLFVATIYIIIQNGVGVALASALGLNPLMGLIAGSITLSGGHGTGAAWAGTFTEQYGIQNTLELAMASATFGLIIGGIIGGPVGNRLATKNKLSSEFGVKHDIHTSHPELMTYDEAQQDKVTSKSIVEVIGLLMICVVGAKTLGPMIKSLGIQWLMIPDFVYALFIGVIITNLFEATGIKRVNMETVHILGTTSLNFFLSMALMSLQLWEIYNLAVPFLIILTVQTIVMALFAYFVTFRVMGKNYDAAVIASGHCGFGMGATPTAVMNMGSTVSRFGPSPMAFMVVPIVGAFFIDLTNLIIIQSYIFFIS